MSDVPEGYKMSDVGVIPEDWDVKKLGELGSFSKGKGIKKDEVVSEGLPCIRYGEIYTIHNDYIKSFKSFITQSLANDSIEIKKGDLLFTGSGETAEEIGKCVAFVGNERVYAGGDIVILRPSIIANSLFLGFLLNNPIVSKQKARMGQGDAVVHISGKNLSEIQIPLPPFSEQQAIASALSDTEALITALEQLITKKRNIKQGAMQQLLTGEKRLPGFELKKGYKQTEVGVIPEDWDVKKLNNMATITRLAGYEYSSMWEDKKNGEIIALRGFNIGENRIIEKDFSRISNELSLKLKRSRLYKNDVIYPCVGTIGNAVVIEDDNKYHIQQNIAKITPNKKEVDSYYLAHYLISHLGLNEITKFNGTSSQPNILVGSLRQYSIVLPPTKSEQTAIGTILSDMDADIESLEQNRDKYAMLKQGMMQELLTGKTRLV